MHLKINFFLPIAFGCLSRLSILSAETLPTSYPSPYGSYTTLSASGNAYLAIQNGSNVGIGTNNPSDKLTISGGNVRFDTASMLPGFYFQYAGGRAGLGSALIMGDEAFRIDADPSTHGAALRLTCDSGWSPHVHFDNNLPSPGYEYAMGTSGPTILDPDIAQGTFVIRENGGPAYLTIWAFSDPVRPGFVGIGRFTDGVPANYMLDVQGSITVAGTVYSNGNCISSDARLKRDIRPLSGVAEKVVRLRGVSFNWTDEFKKKHGNAAEGRQIGVIAQEVEKEFPELVSATPDGMLGVDYGKLSAVLLQAVKEQEMQLDELETQLKMTGKPSGSRN